MPRIEYPECGRIVNTHGCRGAVKVEPWCDSPEVFAALPAVYMKQGESYRRVALGKTSVFNRFVFAELEGVNSMEAADLLRNTVLYARREDLKLPEGTLLVAEIIGMSAIDANSGEKLGVVRDVIHPGATDIYVIDTPRGEAMVPAVPAFVRSLDETGLYLTPIEGMFP